MSIMARNLKSAMKCIRFYPALDVILLKEVVALNPTNKDAWERVHQGVNAAIKQSTPEGFVTLRTCKDRVKVLQEAHRKGEMAALRASGTDEEYNERNQLLTEMASLDDEKAMQQIDVKENNRKEEQGKDIRNAAMERLKNKKKPWDEEQNGAACPERGENTPKRRRSTNSDAYIQYLKDKLEYDKQRLELETKEKEAKIEHDREMMRLMIALIPKKD